MSVSMKATFNTVHNSKYDLMIDDIRDDLTEEDITNALNAIIESNVIDKDGDKLLSIDEVSLITTEVTDITL